MATPRLVDRSAMKRLRTTAKHVEDGWILLDDEDGQVVLSLPSDDFYRRNIVVRCSRRTFNALIDWYQKDQKLREATRAR